MRGVNLIERLRNRSILTWYLAGLMMLLPLQTRWIFDSSAGDLMVLSVYAVEFFIVAGIIAAGVRLELSKQAWKAVAFGASLIVLTVLSGAWAAEPVVTLHVAMHLTVALMLLMLLMDARVDRYVVLKAFCLGLVIPVVVGGYQVLVGDFPASTILGIAERSAERAGDSVFWVNGERWLRAYGVFPHPNIFGGYLALAVTWLTLNKTQLESNGKLVYWTLITLLGLGLLLTMSQGAWLALFAATVVYKTSRKINWKQWLLPMVAGLTALFAAVSWLDTSWIAALPQSITDRFMLAERALRQFIEMPFLGTGAGNYIASISNGGTTSAWWNYQPVHHVGLLMLAEFGLVGLGLLIFSAWKFLKDFWTGMNTSQLVLITIFITLGFVDHYLWTQWSGFVLIVIGIAMLIQMKRYD